MPTRKQRRRELKAKRHEYEFVYVDEEGNELDEAPPELLEQEERRKQERTNGSKAAAAKGAAQQKGKAGARSRREPQPPSWNRAIKRAGLLGIVVFFLFSLGYKAHGGYLAAIVPAVIYTALFIPFTYMIDRFAYRRFQARQAADAGGKNGAASRSTQRPAKKR